VQGRLKFFGDHAALADRRAFKRFLAPLRKSEPDYPGVSSDPPQTVDMT